MTQATVGTRYQVVIPRKERSRLGLRPGSKVQVCAEKDRIIIYPINNNMLRGIGKDIADDMDPSTYIKRLREEWESRS